MGNFLCDTCRAGGLPILPVRYAVVPSTIGQGLPGWVSGDRVTGVPLGAEFKYALRTMRAGYVYLFYSKNQYGPNVWECFVVTGDGQFYKQPDPLMAEERPPEKIACASHQGSPRLNHLVIERPDKCGPTWIAFSAHKWSEETLDEYMANSKLRNARMQTIHPSEMAKGAKHSHGTLATQAALEQVLEYAAIAPHWKLPYEGPSSILSTEDGGYRADRLLIVSTLYPWSLRQGRAEADVQAMQLRAKKADGSSNTPHVLALWDAIGITHELNGFRNDAAGWADLYRRERELELRAANTLAGLRDALVNHAGEVQEKQQKERLDNAANWYSPKDAAVQRANAQKLPEPQRTRQLEVCDIVDDWARRQVPSLGFQHRLNTVNQLPEPQRSQEINRIKSDVDRFTKVRAKNYGNNIDYERDKAAKDWPKYQNCVELDALDLFQKNHRRFADAADTLIDRRTESLVAWLEAPLFVDALEDFHSTNIADGVLFEDAVSAACFGMGTTARGAAKIDEWVHQAKASVKTNLLWRTIALNQQEGIAALDAALDDAKKHHAAQTLSSTLTWTGYIAKVMKGLADTYKKAQGVYDANTKAASAAGTTVFGARISSVNMRGFDIAAITFGDRVFRAFAFDRMGDHYSEKVIQLIFSIRAFVSPLDAELLVATQAAKGQLGREETLRRLQATSAFMKLTIPEEKSAQTESLKAAWKQFQKGALPDASVEDQIKVGQAMKDARLAVVVGLIECVNFMKLMADCKRKGDSKSYLSLLASGMTITSALFDVAATVAKNLPDKTPAPGLPNLGGASWTYQTLKAWGGVLSGGASFVGAAIDFMEAGNSSRKGYSLLQGLYVGKGFAGIGAAAITGAVTFTYAAPLLTRLTGRAAVGVAIENVGARAAAIIGFRILGMAVGGWLTVGTLAVQIVIWQVTPNALEDWINHCAFGKLKASGGYRTAKEQEDKLGEVLAEMGLQ